MRKIVIMCRKICEIPRNEFNEKDPMKRTIKLY